MLRQFWLNALWDWSEIFINILKHIKWHQINFQGFIQILLFSESLFLHFSEFLKCSRYAPFFVKAFEQVVHNKSTTLQYEFSCFIRALWFAHFLPQIVQFSGGLWSFFMCVLRVHSFGKRLSQSEQILKFSGCLPWCNVSCIFKSFFVTNRLLQESQPYGWIKVDDTI